MSDLEALADFLEARIAEDEQLARGSWPEAWQVEGNNVVSVETGLQAGYEGLRIGVAHLAMTVGKYQAEARNADHIARHDPALALRECEAKRKIVEACRVAQEDSWASGRINDPTRALAEEVLTALAQVYADHEQFREEWQE